MSADVQEAIERLRLKLIDLTSANRLLNFKHGSGTTGAQSSLRFADELPDALWQRLVGDQKALVLDPVPEPSRRELERWQAERGAMPGLETEEAQRLLRPREAATWAGWLWPDRVLSYELPQDLDPVEREARHVDGRVQTLLYPDQLETRCRRLRSNARTALEETGANMLFLAVGFLEWRDKPAFGQVEPEGRGSLAPLLLAPVALEPETSAKGVRRYRLSWTGEEVQTNLSLKLKLKRDFDIDLPDLGEDGPEAYFRRIGQLAATRPGWRVRRMATLTLLTNLGRLLLYLDLDPANWPAESVPADHPIVGEVLNAARAERDGGDRLSTGGLGEEEARRIDVELELIERADSSQARAIRAALSGRSLVVQGPPGTGKSQTITNLIAAALGQGKTVLFVAEKLAALEVVRRRLKEAGLGDFCLELHSHKTRKKAFFEDVERRLKRPDRGEPATIDRTLRDLAEERERLHEHVLAVSEPAGRTGLSVSALLQTAGAERLARAELASLVEAQRLAEAFADPLELEAPDRANAERAVSAAAEAADALTAHGGADCPWRGVSARSLAGYDGGEAMRLLQAWRDAALTVSAAAEAVAPEAVGGGADVASARALLDRATSLSALRAAVSDAEAALARAHERLGPDLGSGRQAVGLALSAAQLAGAAPAGAPELGHPGLDHPEAPAALERLERAVEARRAAALALAGKAERGAEAIGAEALRRAGKTLTTAGFFERFGGDFRQARAVARERLTVEALRQARSQGALLLQLAALADADAEIAADERARAAAGPHFRGADTDVAPLRAACAWRAEVRSTFAAQPTIGARLQRLDAPALAEVAGLGGAGLEAFSRVAGAMEAGSDDPDLWRAAASGAAELPWRGALQRCTTPAEVEALMDGLERLVRADADLADAKARAVEALGLDLPQWFGGREPAAPEAVGARAARALERPAGLSPWLDYQRARDEAVQPGAAAVLERVEAGTLRAADAGHAWRIAWSLAAARKALARDPRLLARDGKGMRRLRNRYAELDDEVMQLRRRRIASQLMKRVVPKGIKAARVRDLTDLALLEHHIGASRAPALRTVVDRAGGALQALKPCFMMGPLSVAQYLKPGALRFDLVIMDEASQMRPEDALGAIARGGQLVVVGDDKQLPPTAFFAGVSDGGADADDDGADGDGAYVGQNDPSILTRATAAFGAGGSPMLSWHYRSRHPELIAFSNDWFYRGELVVFPAPTDADAVLGLELRPVSGVCAVGGINDTEARAVATAAVEHLRRHPGRSLGVAAMNLKQKERIEDHIRKLAADDPEVSAALDRGEDDQARIEPFFVKNLENVQGDERDLIMISMTYGPREPGGKVPQGFGPINSAGGERRLNVLFSRAKERMVVFSSMRSTDIAAGPTSPEGVRALQGFLAFAETGRLPSGARLTGRPPESPFEEAVATALERAGYQVECQLGVESFRIDLVVRDPEDPRAFLLAIECDGAAYHSSASARDRDRLRQEVLERMGWKFERIWSTDWFRDPQGETDRVIARLRGLQAARPRPAPEPPRLSPSAPIIVPPDPDRPRPGGAVAPVPSLGALTLAEARDRLIEVREAIERDHPDWDPDRGLLRPALLDRLLRERPGDADEFRRKVSADMREGTNGAELKAYGERVFDILAEVR